MASGSYLDALERKAGKGKGPVVTPLTLTKPPTRSSSRREETPPQSQPGQRRIEQLERVRSSSQKRKIELPGASLPSQVPEQASGSQAERRDLPSTDPSEERDSKKRREDEGPGGRSPLSPGRIPHGLQTGQGTLGEEATVPAEQGLVVPQPSALQEPSAPPVKTRKTRERFRYSSRYNPNWDVAEMDSVRKDPRVAQKLALGLALPGDRGFLKRALTDETIELSLGKIVEGTSLLAGMLPHLQDHDNLRKKAEDAAASEARAVADRASAQEDLQRAESKVVELEANLAALKDELLKYQASLESESGEKEKEVRARVRAEKEKNDALRGKAVAETARLEAEASRDRARADRETLVSSRDRLVGENKELLAQLAEKTQAIRDLEAELKSRPQDEKQVIERYKLSSNFFDDTCASMELGWKAALFAVKRKNPSFDARTVDLRVTLGMIKIFEGEGQDVLAEFEIPDELPPSADTSKTTAPDPGAEEGKGQEQLQERVAALEGSEDPSGTKGPEGAETFEDQLGRVVEEAPGSGVPEDLP